MTEEGTVVAAENGRIIVEMESGASCEGCAMGHSCMLVQGAARRRIAMENRLAAVVGDRVRFDIHPGAVMLGSALHYALPVLLLLAGIVAGALTGERAGWKAEVASLAGGVAGLLLSALLIALLAAAGRRRSVLVPRLLEILSRPGGN